MRSSVAIREQRCGPKRPRTRSTIDPRSAASDGWDGPGRARTSGGRERSRLFPVVALALAVGLAGCRMTLLDEAGYLARANGDAGLAPDGGDVTRDGGPTSDGGLDEIPSNAIYVDGQSLGGPCDDARTAEEARTRETPWCTLSRALEATPRDAPVLVRGATYPALEASVDTGRSAELRLRAFPGEKVEIRGALLAQQRHLRFERIHFINGVALQAGVEQIAFVECDFTSAQADSAVIALDSATDISFIGCTVHDLASTHEGLTGFGVFARGGQRFRIIGNQFLDLETAMKFENMDDLLVEANRIPHAQLAPIQVTGSRDVTIRGNRIHDSQSHLWLVDLERLTLENNLFTRFPYWAIHMGSIRVGRIVNNTIWSNGTGGIELSDLDGPASSGLTVQNNLLQTLDGSAQTAMFSDEDFNLIGGGYRQGAHDLSGSPRFVDAAAFDYHLAPGSPGIDAARADGAPAADADGRARHDDPGVANTGEGTPPYGDLGALESRP